MFGIQLKLRLGSHVSVYQLLRLNTFLPASPELRVSQPKNTQQVEYNFTAVELMCTDLHNLKVVYHSLFTTQSRVCDSQSFSNYTPWPVRTNLTTANFVCVHHYNMDWP